jgi:DNA polymerase-3 subunit gamma/tau
MEETVRQMLGAVDRQHVQRLIEAVADGDGAAVVAAVDTVRELGLSGQGTLEELAAALQRMAVVQAVPALASGDAKDPDAEVWARLALRLAPDETQLFYSLCLHGRAELALAPDEHSGLLMLMLRLLAFKPSGGGPADPKPQGPAKSDNAGPAHRLPSGGPSSARLIGIGSANAEAAPARAPEDVQGVPPWDAQAPEPDERPSGPSIDEGPPAWLDGPELDTRAAVQQPGMSPPAPAGPPSLAPIPHPHAPDEPAHAKAAVAANPLADHWADLVAQMQSRGLIAALVRELAVQAECVSQAVHEGVSHWHLRVERGSLMGDAQRDRLQAAMSQCLAMPVQLVLQQGPAQDTPALRDLAAREARQRAAEVLIAQDPLVRRLLADHPGARLVAGSVHPMAPVAKSDPDTATITP